jgi:signal transduction histidine kinase
LIEIKTLVQGSDVEIRIGDNGTGIDKETCARIFEPLFTAKAVGVGTGQGLAQVHSTISDQHGGSVEVESEVGRGTTFVLRFPITPPKADPPE